MRHNNKMSLFSALALVACVITITTGCDGDVQPTTDPAGETATVFRQLGACESDLACDAVNYEALGIAHLETCLACSCAPSPDDPEVNTLQLSFLTSCVSDLGCVTNLDCAGLNDACNSASCVMLNCVVAPIADPSPEADGECLERTCDTETGWGNTPLPAETACNDGDECTTASSCDGEGVCVSDAASNVCCYRYDDCNDSCSEGELDACRAPTGDESELTGDFGRCVCYPEDGFSDTDSSSCCLGHGGLGCTPPSDMAPSSEEVCSADPWCCETGWDAICANLYASAYPGVCDYLTAEICDDDIDNDRDGLVDCDDSDCAENPACAAPPSTDVALEVNEGFLIRGCLGETSLAAPYCLACDVTDWDNTGRSSYTVMEGQALLFNVLVTETGLSIPDITSVGPPLEFNLRGFTLGDIFVDSTLGGLSCEVVSTFAGGENWLCTNGELSSGE